MKRAVFFLTSNKRMIAIVAIVLIVGAFFRWEVKEVDDPKTGKRITTYHGIVFPWEPCGPGNIHANGMINFHVRHWVFYGFVRIEATGQTFSNS